MSTIHFTTTVKFENKIKKLSSDYNLELTNENEVQTLTVTGTPDGGTFTLNYDGQVTSAIAYNASAAVVVAALEALSNIEAGDILGSGGPLPGTAVVLTFTGNLASTNAPLIEVDDALLSGGSSPEATMAETTKGIGDSVIAERRLEQSYDEILGTLLNRGLTEVQISTWARGEEFQLDIATYWYAKDCGWGAKTFDDKDWTKFFDRREELKTVALISNDGDVLSKSGIVAKTMDLMAINKDLGISY